MTLRSYSAERLELTPRMRDVLRLKARGLTVQAIAAELAVSPSTVKSELCASYDRLTLAAAARGEL